MRCFHCDEEVSAVTVVYYPVAGERVPFHRALTKDCLNDHIKEELARIKKFHRSLYLKEA